LTANNGRWSSGAAAASAATIGGARGMTQAPCSRRAVGAGTGHSGGNCRRVPSVPDLSSALSAVGGGAANWSRRWSCWRGNCTNEGRLIWTKLFRGCNLASAKKGLASAPPVAGKGTKILAIAAGNSLLSPLLSIAASPAECQLGGEQVLAGSSSTICRRGSIGDKAYDSVSTRNSGRLRHRADCAEPAHEKQDRGGTQTTPLQRRWRVERLFAWMHNFRRRLSPLGVPHRQLLGFVRLACPPLAQYL